MRYQFPVIRGVSVEAQLTEVIVSLKRLINDLNAAESINQKKISDLEREIREIKKGVQAGGK